MKKAKNRSLLVPEQEQIGAGAAVAPGDAVQSRLCPPDDDLMLWLANDATPPGLESSTSSTPLNADFEDAKRSEVSVGRHQRSGGP